MYLREKVQFHRILCAAFSLEDLCSYKWHKSVQYSLKVGHYFKFCSLVEQLGCPNSVGETECNLLRQMSCAKTYALCEKGLVNLTQGESESKGSS